jgi:hypothetical protein
MKACSACIARGRLADAADIQRIVANSTPSERIVVAYIQLFPLNAEA